MPGRILIVLMFILLTDVMLHLMPGWCIVSRSVRRRLRMINMVVACTWYLFSIIFIIANGYPDEDPLAYRLYFQWMNLGILLYLSKFILLLFLIPLIPACLSMKKRKESRKPGWFYLYKYFWTITAIFFSLLTFYIITDGIYRGNKQFQVRRVDIAFPDLPPAFNEFTIAQFSDIHLGSWKDKKTVEDMLAAIQSFRPDMIVFTGDLINVNISETDIYKEDFRKLTALAGKFAILGNHDVGDFARRKREEAIGRHIPALERFYEATGFSLLRNQHHFIYKGLDSIAIAGTDNWSKHRHRQMGDLEKAIRGIGDSCFTILLTHDPSHWTEEVLPSSKIGLTLSGHTHAGQLVFTFAGRTWSPVSLLYPTWYGLYQKGERYLYVNPGLGFVGFTARSGIAPEITLLNLRKSSRNKTFRQ
ncbi:MAG TPA: metallophosphoesterase [Bacteroidales bacterium]|nr:metallophosphoesterase [Bacteroidales bacterium]HSA42504.1 metallophosphoesterase [Bacteroidales bacterium]